MDGIFDQLDDHDLMTLSHQFTVKEQQNRVVVVGCQENKKQQNSYLSHVRRPCHPRFPVVDTVIYIHRQSACHTWCTNCKYATGSKLNLSEFP